MMFLELAIIFFGHFIADFVTQPREVAKGKGKEFSLLLEHITLYGVFLSSVSFLIPVIRMSVDIIPSVLGYVVFNTLLHLCTDYFTSKYTSYFWERGNEKAFWVIIGADQLIHKLCLLLTYPLFLM